MTYPATLDGAAVQLDVGADALRAGSVAISYPDMDDVTVDGWSVTMRGPGVDVTFQQLGRGRDRFLEELREKRFHARRAAMLQSGTAAPLDSYAGFRGEVPVVVGVHEDGITIEPDAGTTDYIPLSCVANVARDGYAITFECHGMDPVGVAKLGARTDEFLQDVEAARRALAVKTSEAYAALDPALATLPAADGWAITQQQAGPGWAPLRAAFAGTDRADQIALLESLAGDALRLGVKAAFSSATMPFALARRGGRIAVEGAGDEARATFVFACDDADRLNVALLQTGFRREALSVPEDQLGRWAVAVRMLPVVRWARAALVARIVHDDAWADKVKAALA